MAKSPLFVLFALAVFWVGGLRPVAADSWPAALEIGLEQLDAGAWRLSYEFALPVGRLDLGPSVNGFRTRDWKVVTPGLELIAEDGRDYIVAQRKKSAFAKAVIRVTPQANNLEKEYEPIAVFADGGAVIYTGHFWPRRRDGRRYDAVFEFTPQAGWHVAAFGESAARADAWVSPYRHPAFVYMGPLAPARHGGAQTIIDPTAPDWVADIIKSTTPSLLSEMSRAFGRTLEAAPDLIVRMGESGEPWRMRYNGDALPGQFQITLSGGAWRTPSDSGRRLLLTATAHEAAHLWQSAARPKNNATPAWIHEGAADAIAIESLQMLGQVSDAEARAGLQRARLECGDMLVGRSLARAESEGDWRASYACGQVIAVIAARASGAPSVAAFWGAFADLAANEGGYDADLLYRMAGAGAGSRFEARLRRFATTRFAAPEKELARLLRQATDRG